MDPREGRGCCLLTSPSLGYNVTGLVAGAALGTRGSCDGIAVGNSKYKTGEINSVCVSFCGVGEHGPWVGALLRVGQARWSNQTLLRKCTNFTAAHTHIHLWIGKSTWPQGRRKQGGMAACNMAFATASLEIGKALG